MYVVLYVWIDDGYAPRGRLNGFYSYLIFKIASVIGMFAGNTNTLAPKLGALEMDLSIKMIFSKAALTNLLKIN
jgi:hypothetical protein